MISSYCSRVGLFLAALVSGAFAGDSKVSPVHEHAVEHLAAFARVYGYVRFFHPSDQAAVVDWDAMAVLGAELTANAADEGALRAALLEVFGPVSAGLRFLDGGEESVPNAVVESASSVTYWQHHGVRLSDQSNIYQSKRVVSGGVAAVPPLFDADVPPAFLDKVITAKLRLRLPLVLPVSAEGKTVADDPSAFAALQKRLAAIDTKSLKVDDWRLRAGGIIAAWNVFQHFHPYLDRVGIKWEQSLRPALRRSLTDRTRLDYYATLSEMVAGLQDGHGYVYGRGAEVGGLPIRVELIEGQIVVTGATSGAPFQKGDILKSVGGVAALEVLREREHYISGSPHLRRYRALNQYGEGEIGSTIQVDLLRDGEPKSMDYVRAQDRRGFFFNSIAEFEFPTFAEVKPGIFYVNLQSIAAGELAAKIPELAKARGVIFDQRWDGRPSTMKPEDRVSVHRHVIPHLTSETVQASPMLTPRITLPDREGWSYRESTWPVPPLAPRFAGRIVFINVPAVVSYGETCMAMIAHHKLATLVGEPTAGCNGNANYVLLPGGFRIMWTGMEVLKLDRSPFYGTGFVPDFPVARTVAAVKAGRDEFLEKAIAVIETGAND